MLPKKIPSSPTLIILTNEPEIEDYPQFLGDNQKFKNLPEDSLPNLLVMADADDGLLEFIEFENIQAIVYDTRDRHQRIEGLSPVGADWRIYFNGSRLFDCTDIYCTNNIFEWAQRAGVQIEVRDIRKTPHLDPREDYPQKGYPPMPDWFNSAPPKGIFGLAEWLFQEFAQDIHEKTEPMDNWTTSAITQKTWNLANDLKVEIISRSKYKHEWEAFQAGWNIAYAGEPSGEEMILNEYEKWVFEEALKKRLATG